MAGHSTLRVAAEMDGIETPGRAPYNAAEDVPMNRTAIYDDDILQWSEQQAAALRRLAWTRRDLSNEVDWEHVAEEIEDVGRSQLLAVQSLIRQVLIHVIKGVSVGETEPMLHWRKEVVAFHTDLIRRFTPSMRSRCDLAEIRHDAIRQADADLAIHKQSIMPALRTRCPLTLDEILDPQFDFIASVEAVRKRLQHDTSQSGGG